MEQSAGIAPYPTSISEITFSTSDGVNSSIYKTLNSLRKSTLSIPNRLRSILEDADFIRSYFANHTDYSRYPIIANERCGSWYIEPELKGGSAYFKSTDGHHGQWSFSTRRLNLKLLEILGEHGGAVLVDSTRRGKRLPDALRRTVPIWVAVWNRLLFGSIDPSQEHKVSSMINAFQSCGLEPSEVKQIGSRIKGWVNDLEGLGLDLADIKVRMKRPIKCVWVVHGEGETLPDGWSYTSAHDVDDPVKLEWSTLVLCSASKRVIGAEMSEEGYIQGAGDDSEGWSCGLTATLFWQHKDLLLNTPQHELPDLIRDLVEKNKVSARDIAPVQISPTRNLFITASDYDSGGHLDEQYDLMICCNGHNEGVSKDKISLSCRDGKLGSRDLREKLALVKDATEQAMRKDSKCKILVQCDTGKDLSVGVAVTLLCLFYDGAGQLDFRCMTQPIHKQMVKQRLAWITSCKPEANPSRSTLQAVNSFLIDRPK